MTIEDKRVNAGLSENVTEFQLMQELDDLCQRGFDLSSLGITSNRDIEPEVQLVIENQENTFIETLFDLEMEQYDPSNCASQSTFGFMMKEQTIHCSLNIMNKSYFHPPSNDSTTVTYGLKWHANLVSGRQTLNSDLVNIQLCTKNRGVFCQVRKISDLVQIIIIKYV
jgi:hypothetical protein